MAEMGKKVGRPVEGGVKTHRIVVLLNDEQYALLRGVVGDVGTQGKVARKALLLGLEQMK